MLAARDSRGILGVKGVGGGLRGRGAEGIVGKRSPGGILRVRDAEVLGVRGTGRVLGVMNALGEEFRRNTQ